MKYIYFSFYDLRVGKRKYIYILSLKFKSIFIVKMHIFNYSIIFPFLNYGSIFHHIELKCKSTGS